MEFRTSLEWETFSTKRALETSKPCYMQDAEWDCLESRKLSTLEVINRYWRGVAYHRPIRCERLNYRGNGIYS